MARSVETMKVPKFKSEKEEAEFWDTHSIVDYFDDMQEAAPLKLSPKLKEKLEARRRNKVLLTLRIDPRLIDQAKQVAEQKAIGYQTLMQMWIAEGLNHEKFVAREKRSKYSSK